MTRPAILTLAVLAATATVTLVALPLAESQALAQAAHGTRKPWGWW